MSELTWMKTPVADGWYWRSDVPRGSGNSARYEHWALPPNLEMVYIEVESPGWKCSCSGCKHVMYFGPIQPPTRDSRPA